MAVLHPANCKDNFNFCEKNDIETGVPLKKQKSGLQNSPLIYNSATTLEQDNIQAVDNFLALADYDMFSCIVFKPFHI